MTDFYLDSIRIHAIPLESPVGVPHEQFLVGWQRWSQILLGNVFSPSLSQSLTS